MSFYGIIIEVLVSRWSDGITYQYLSGKEGDVAAL